MRQLLAAALAARAAAFHGGSPSHQRREVAADAPWWDDHATDEPNTPWWEPDAEKEHTTPWDDHAYDEHKSYASGPWAVVALAALGVLAAVYVDADREPLPPVRRRRRRTRHVRPAPSVSEPSSALRALFAPQPAKIYGNDSENEDAPPRLVTEMRPFHVFGGAHLRIVRFDPHTAEMRGPSYKPLTDRFRSVSDCLLIDENTTLPEGTHVFAHAPGCGADLRVAPPLGSGLPFGRGECWHHLVALPLPRTRDQGGAVQLDRRALAVGAAGGQLDIDANGRLKRWCCYTYASYVDAEAVARVARHVPLPFERLWLVAVQSSEGEWPLWMPSLERRPSLEKSGRLEKCGSRAFTIKATAHDDRRAYEAAKRVALRAREARREARIALADHGPEHPLTIEALHLREAAKRELVETGALSTYARAAHERRARRALGLIDERWPRLLCRLRLLELAQRCPDSPLGRVPPEIVGHVASFLKLRPRDLAVARRRCDPGPP